MDEQQLRGLVREAIARHLGPSSAAADPVPLPSAPTRPTAGPGQPIAVTFFDLPRRPGEVECVIEPTVTCNHCGHCLCYGH